MEVMGIKFAPLHIPLSRRLETLCAGGWVLTYAFGIMISPLLTVYLLIYSSYWISIFLYLMWLWFIDRDTCDRGGRRLNWVRNLSWWKYMKDYFPVTVKKLPGVVLNPKRNYLFCSFPHGMLSTGAFCAFATNATDFNELYPNHTPHLITLKSHFIIPFFRELIYSLGMCSSTSESIKWILKNPDGGNIAVIIVGGTAEAYHCRPGPYRLVLKNRKGFVKLALKTGSPLVPVFSFGETEIFDQVSNPEGSLLRTIQDWTKNTLGIPPLIPIGRGFLQYSFGFVPYRKPLTVLIGQPIDVQKVEDPTPQQISDLHENFINSLSKLFEEHKHKYLEDADNAQLIIS